MLILLIHHYTNWDENSLHFTSSGERSSSSNKVCDIAYMKNSLPCVIVECILPIHTFLVCDTVSRVYSIGKGKKSLNKILGREKMLVCLREFNKKDAEKASITREGEELPSQFCESRAELLLNSLRYRIFHKKNCHRHDCC